VSERLQSNTCAALPRDAGSFYSQSSPPLTNELRPSESHRRLQAQRRLSIPHRHECGATGGAPVRCLREAREARRCAVAKEASPGAGPSPVSLEPRRRAPVALASLAVEGFCDAAPAQRLHHHAAERPRRGLARRLPNGDRGGCAGRSGERGCCVRRGGRVTRDVIRDARRPQPPRVQPHVEARRRDATTDGYGAPETPEPRESAPPPRDAGYARLHRAEEAPPRHLSPP